MKQEKTKKIKIVCDTNIFISMIVFSGGLPEDIFKQVKLKEFDLGISKEILNEITYILINKFSWPLSQTKEIIELINNNSMVVMPDKKLKIINDDYDNRILECAEKFNADYLISGDKHILTLKKYKNIKIVTAREFIKNIEEK
ncbi:MAG: putative toxin-antitoxin system toxin component, PIN family [Candidatus Firestonebacteria bacterium]